MNIASRVCGAADGRQTDGRMTATSVATAAAACLAKVPTNNHRTSTTLLPCYCYGQKFRSFQDQLLCFGSSATVIGLSVWLPPRRSAARRPHCGRVLIFSDAVVAFQVCMCRGIYICPSPLSDMSAAGLNKAYPRTHEWRHAGTVARQQIGHKSLQTLTLPGQRYQGRTRWLPSPIKAEK